MTPTWSDVKAQYAAIIDSWDAAYAAAWEQAQDAYFAVVSANPGEYVATVVTWLDGMGEARQTILDIEAMLKARPDPLALDQLKAAATQWNNLALGAYPFMEVEGGGGEAEDFRPVQLSGLPVVLAVGLVISIPAICWMIVRQGQAANLNNWLRLQKADLQARFTLNAQGQTLQTSTANAANPAAPPPAPPDNGGGGGGLGTFAAIGAGLGLLGAIAYFGRQAKVW